MTIQVFQVPKIKTLACLFIGLNHISQHWLLINVFCPILTSENKDVKEESFLAVLDFCGF